jgi:chromosomal replication initiation ATPase DnaA
MSKLESNVMSPYVYVGIRTRDLPHDFKVRVRRRACRYKQDHIITAIELVTGYGFEEIRSKYRGRNLVQARQIYCHFVRVLLGWSLKDIGGTIGRDHTTVIHSIDTFSDLYKTDPNFKDDADNIQQEIEWMTKDII